MQTCSTSRCVLAVLRNHLTMTINQCALKINAARRCLLHITTNGNDDRALLKLRNSPIATLQGGGNQTREFALWSTKPSVCDDPPPTDKCPARNCNPPKKGWFAWLFGGGAKKDAPPQRGLPDVRCCRKKYCRQLKNEPDPDFSEFGGQAYKTCGIAYVIQRDRLQPKRVCESREDRLLRQIETHPDLQTRMIHEDPIKDSDNLFTRLVEMSDMGLHPLYKKIAATPIKEGVGACKHVRPYRTLTGPIDHSDLPAQIKINRGQLERKNIYWCYKSVAPPGDLEGRILETKPRAKNVRRSNCPKRESNVFDMEKLCDTRVKRETVFDSLKQKPMDFYGACKDDDRDRSEIVYNPAC